jgi:hypothetical protein
LYERVAQGGFAVVDVGDYGDVADVVGGVHYLADLLDCELYHFCYGGYYIGQWNVFLVMKDLTGFLAI